MKSLWFQLVLWFGIPSLQSQPAFVLLDNFRDNVTAPDTRTTVEAQTSRPLAMRLSPRMN